MTPAERKALLFLASVGVLGAGTRVVGGEERAAAAPTAQERRALDAQLAAVDSARAADEARRGDRRWRRRVGAGAEGGMAAGGTPAAPAIVGDGRWPAPVRAPAVIVGRSPASGGGSSDGGSAGGARAGRRRRAGAAPGATLPIDVDLADAAALETLPGIGPALARRIVGDRAAGGAFGSVAGLTRVRGVGPKLAERLAPVVTFSGTPRPSSAGDRSRPP